MKITANKIRQILELLPDFDSSEGNDFKFQIHKAQNIVFTLSKPPVGIDVYELTFKKNHRLQDWECEMR